MAQSIKVYINDIYQIRGESWIRRKYLKLVEVKR